MPLHDRQSIKGALQADIYGTRAVESRCRISTWTGRAASRRGPCAGPRRAVPGRQRPPEPVDILPDPATAEIESRCVNILADLWHSPEAANTIGCSTTGSSEACMLGGLALKWKWRQRREAQGLPTGKPNLVTGPVQVCWNKFARYFDVELREIPLEKGRLGMTPAEMLKHVDENTIGVMPTFDVTFTCHYEPVAEPPPRSTSSRPRPASTSRSTSTPLRAGSSRRSSNRAWCGISALSA